MKQIDNEVIDAVTLRLSKEYPLLDFSFCEGYYEELGLILREIKTPRLDECICSKCGGAGLVDEHYVQEKHEHTGRKISCFICQGTGRTNQ